MDGPHQATPRTLLEALVRDRGWSQRQFCDEYARAASAAGRPLTISPQHAGRWLAGQLKGVPYPSQRRVLERMFDLDVTQLFRPPPTDPTDDGRTPSCPARPRQEPGEEIDMAAGESARFAQFAETSNVGPVTLEQFQADVRHIVTQYPNRPVYPIFVELRALRSRAFEILEGHQRPDQARDMYLVAGLLCGVLANASFDLGRLGAAETQARTAFLCAELAGHNALRAWIRGTQALVAYWDDRPQTAIDLAIDGSRYTPETGTSLVRLAAIEARARGRIRDRHGVDQALARAGAARDRVPGLDDPGGMMAFPQAKQDFYAATARLWLGDPDSGRRAETDAANAVDAYEQDPECRRLGELNLARLDLAAARLARHELPGAAQEVRTVLRASRQRPTDSVSRRLHQVDAVLARPAWHDEPSVLDLRDEIHTLTRRQAIPALPRKAQQ